MWRKDAFSGGFSFALGAAVLAVLLYGAWLLLQAALAIATPFIGGTVVAILLDPVVDRIQARWAKGRRLPAVILVFTAFLAVFVGLVAFVVPNLVTQTQALVVWFTPTTYTVERAQSPSGPFSTVASGVVTTTYVVRNLTGGVPYYFRVQAIDRNGAHQLIGDGPIRSVPTGDSTPHDDHATPASSPSGASHPLSSLLQRPSPAATATASDDNGSTDSATPASEPTSHPNATPSPVTSEDSATPHPSLTPVSDGDASPGSSPATNPVTNTDLSGSLEASDAVDATPSPEASAGDEERTFTSEAALPTPTVGGIASASPRPMRPVSQDPTPISSLRPVVTGVHSTSTTRTQVSRKTHETGSSRVTRKVDTTTTTRRTSMTSSDAHPAAVVAPKAAGTRIIATPGEGNVTLHWRAPTSDVEGIDKIRVQIDQWLTMHRKIGPFVLPASFESITAQYSDQVAQALKMSASRVGDIILASVSRLIAIVLIPIVTFYVLSDIDRLRGRFLFLLPERLRMTVQASAVEIGAVFGGYMRGMLFVSLGYGLVTMLFFALPLKSYALLLGVAAGVLYVVPYVGPLTTALLTAILSLITGHGMGGTLGLLAMVLVQNQVFDNVVVPRVVGKSVGLHPLLTLFALLLGGGLFGLWGMLLSVPVAASIQVILFRLYPKFAAPTPLSMLMDNNQPAAEEDNLQPLSGDSEKNPEAPNGSTGGK